MRNLIFILLSLAFLGCASSKMQKMIDNRRSEIQKSYDNKEISKSEYLTLMNQVDVAVIEYNAKISSRPSSFVYTYDLNK